MSDEDFKQDINHIRKGDEQKLIGALTRFHYRKIERTKNKLRKTEQKMNLAKAKLTMRNLSKTGHVRPETISLRHVVRM